MSRQFSRVGQVGTLPGDCLETGPWRLDDRPGLDASKPFVRRASKRRPVRSDYPYTMVEMTLDKNGKGAGTAIGAASIRFNKKKNIYEIESFRHGADYNKLLNVRLIQEKSLSSAGN